jgi:hypothetical protein
LRKRWKQENSLLASKLFPKLFPGMLGGSPVAKRSRVEHKEPATMPRSLELTWDKARKRWKKFYKGKQYYFPFGKSKADTVGYAKALDAWKQKKAEVDAIPEADPALDKWERFIAAAIIQQRECEREDTPANRQRWDFLKGLVDSYRFFHREGVPYAGGEDEGEERLPIVGVADEGSPPPWVDRTEEDLLPPDATVGGNIERFLAGKQRLVEKGKLSHGHFGVLRVCLDDFANTVGSTSMPRPVR